MGGVEIRERIQYGCVREQWSACADEGIWPKFVGEHVGLECNGEVEVRKHMGLLTVDEIVAVGLVRLDVVNAVEKVRIHKNGVNILEQKPAGADWW